MRISAFDPLRPPADKAKQVASVPYDVVNRAEAAELAEGNPDSFLHVVRPDIDLPPDTNPYDDAVYAKAAENLKGLVERGALVRHGKPSVFVYRQVMGAHVQDGIVCRCLAEEYDRDIIKKHEKTRPDKEDDRARHVMTLRANAGPVFLTYRDHAHLNSLVEEAVAGEPLFDFFAADYVRHVVWEMPRPEKVIEAFEHVPVAYVADGHHRSASASRAAKACREANPNHDGSEDYNWFLTVLFPASKLQILAYNRVVFDLNGHAKDEFLDKVRESFEIKDGIAPEPAQAGEFSMYLDGDWYGLAPKEKPDASDPVRSLDASILQDQLLGPILGVDDPRSSKKIDFVGGIRGTEALKHRVDSGEAAVAFSMHPTSVEQLMAIADAGAIMPPKSTWFEPKLRSGLLVHTF